MQRYRINHNLIIGLLVSLVVFGCGAYFLRAWQVERKAGSYRDLAAQELADGNVMEAFRHQNKYVLLRPSEEDALIEFAEIGLKLLEQSDTMSEERQRAIGALEESVRRTSDSRMRKELAKIILTRYSPDRAIDALNHVEELLIDEPEDTELQEIRIKALFRSRDFKKGAAEAAKLIGFNLKKQKFYENPEKDQLVTDRPEIFSILAQVLLDKPETREASGNVIDKMVELNPDSHLAYLRKSEYLLKLGEKEEALIALDMAYQLDPEDRGVLLQKGKIAAQNREFDEACKILRGAIDKHPDYQMFYRLLAFAENSRGDSDEALNVLEEGIRQFGNRMGADLLLVKIDLQLKKDDFEGVKDSVKDIENLNIPYLLPVAEFAKARILLKQGELAEGTKALERLRPLLINHPTYKARAALELASCYEKLGKPDQALKTYVLVRDEFPEWAPMAEQGIRRMEKKLRIGTDRPQESLGMDQLVKAMMALPEEEQEWDKIDQAIDKLAEERGISELQQTLFRMNVFLLRKMPAEAEKLLRQAKQLDPENLDVRFAEVALLASDSSKGPQQAMKVLDEIVAIEGETFRSRTKRIALLLSSNLDDEELVESLLAQIEGIESWTDEEQLKLCSSLAAQFQQLGKVDEARVLWERASKLNPNYLPLRMQLFTLALQQEDDAAVKEIQQGILDLVKDPNDPSYLLTQVQGLLSDYVRKKIEKEELAKARGMLDKALEQREQWHLLHISYGKLLAVLGNDPKVALSHFEDALKYGPPDATAILMQIGIMEQLGQYEAALQKAELLSPAVRERVLGKTEASLLLKLGKKEEAFEKAKKVAELLASDDKTQAWFAGVARETEYNEEAIEALQRALEINPGVDAYWLQLGNLYYEQKDVDLVRETLSDAQFELDAELIPRLMAQQYIYTGQMQIAESIFKGTHEGDYDYYLSNRKMAEFYMLWSRVDETKLSGAFPYINAILRADNEVKAESRSDKKHLRWARERAVRYLASTKDYQNAVKAQQLLEEGREDGKLSQADQILLGEILTTQRDPKSQLRAIDVFEKVHKQQPLDKKHVLMFAYMLNRTDNWDQCDELLTDAISRFEKDFELWTAYINLLIDRGDYEAATARINRLKDLDPNGAVYVQLAARLLSERGQQGKLRSMLKSLVPNMVGALDTAKLQNIANIAALAARSEDYEYAEELYRFYVKRLPKEINQLTTFLALHGDVDEAMQLMQKEFKSNVDGVLALIVRMMRSRRSEIGDRHDEAIDKMIRFALRDDPDSIARLAMQAELLETQQRYDESIAAYDGLLQRDDLNVAARATCLNNLGFLLALKEQRLDEASDYIEEAMEIYGPIDDMLDTRAILRIARKEYDLAVEDMTLATSVSRDPIKFFHLAKAHLLAGNKEEAWDAWSEAQNLGLEMQSLPVPEQETFPAVEKQMEALRDSVL